MASSKLNDLRDEELLELSLPGAGDSQAEQCWEILFERHRRKVALWCLRFAQDREEAADLAQEVFARAWRRRESFQGGSLFTTWLFTVCRNHCLNHVKARQARPAAEALDELPALAGPGSDPGQEIDAARRRALAQEWMQRRLDERERLAMTLHYAQELPVDTVTRLMGLTNASGAKALLVSARRKLQAAVQEWRAGNDRAGGGEPDA